MKLFTVKLDIFLYKGLAVTLFYWLRVDWIMKSGHYISE